jgi:Zn-dependent protease
LSWVVVVFVSILVHELGHALAFRRFGLSSEIVLHFAGGLTIPQTTLWGNRWANVALGPNQNIFISLAGPGAGFLLAALVIVVVILTGGSIITTRLLGFIPFPGFAVLPFGGDLLSLFVTSLLWINIFWGFINLMPVFPLDGGSVMRNVLIQADPVDGVRKSLWVSVIAGAVIALAAFFFLRSLYMAVLFGFLAFQSYQSLRGPY